MTVVRDENWVMARRNPNHGLTPLRTVLRKYGNPQDDLKIIHVAGTNGKGSVCSYMKDVLQALGYKTGMFTSPHLVSHFDRITVNGEWIPAETYRKYLNMCMDDIEKYDLGMFGIAVLIAFLYFRDEKTDYVILECGLGGRLDNTNVISSPLVSVITTIGSDHAALLGTRAQQVAFEKAGIIRHGVPVCVGNVNEHVRRIISLQAQRKQAPIRFLKPVVSRGEHLFAYDSDTYHIQADAEYQKENASLALMVLKTLGMDIHSETVKQALDQSVWKGRFEKVSEKPDIYLDGAHNKEGVEALLKNYPSLSHPVVTVFSALKDKPGRMMAGMLAKQSNAMIITSIANGRFDSMESLLVSGAEMIEDENRAVDRAIELAGESGTVVICGSLYFISEIRKRWKDGQE